jgi:diguanylate cyclase (GGDEF)-like protein
MLVHQAGLSGWGAAPVLAGIACLVAAQHALAHLARGRARGAALDAARAAQNAADLATAQVALARAHADLSTRNADLESALERITALATTDALTGAANRRHATERLTATDPAQPALLAFVDLDHFKAINDTHGHAAGDAVIAAAARRLRAAAGAHALVGRWGGEEFVVCVGGAGDPAELGERLRAVVSRAPVESGALAIHVTASVGVAARRVDEPLDAWLGRADAGCYGAKRGGRDRVVVA